MKEHIAKCGINCGACPAYKENIKREGDLHSIKKGFLKYHNLYFESEEEIFCDGCDAADNPQSCQLNGSCQIRVCVDERKIENCGYCTEFPCCQIEELVEAVAVIEKTVRETADHEQDYRLFVEPYLIMERINKIRQKKQRGR